MTSYTVPTGRRTRNTLTVDVDPDTKVLSIESDNFGVTFTLADHIEGDTRGAVFLVMENVQSTKYNRRATNLQIKKAIRRVMLNMLTESVKYARRVIADHEHRQTGTA